MLTHLRSPTAALAALAGLALSYDKVHAQIGMSDQTLTVIGLVALCFHLGIIFDTDRIRALLTIIAGGIIIGVLSIADGFNIFGYDINKVPSPMGVAFITFAAIWFITELVSDVIGLFEKDDEDEYHDEYKYSKDDYAFSKNEKPAEEESKGKVKTAKTDTSAPEAPTAKKAPSVADEDLESTAMHTEFARKPDALDGVPLSIIDSQGRDVPLLTHDSISVRSN